MKKTTLFACCISLLLSAKAQEVTSTTPPAIKNRIIKVDFFSPLTGNLTLGYEQPLVNSVTFTGDIGIIGASVVPINNHATGLFVKGGVKFYFSPDYTMDGMKRFNDFQGAYFNPQIIYSGFGFDYSGNSSSGYGDKRGVNNSFALMLQLGKQWILAKTISLELYGGMGYGWSSIYAPDYFSGYGSYDLNYLVPYKYSHLQVSNTIPFALDAGFKIGILLK
ncbi:MAG TPA: DUF3575 domain-containing protein [Chitinophagales bacterium]|nr:DUF3575 domain-containing protein [Chitinophagales bacterium]